MKAKPFLIGLSAGILGGMTAILFTAPQSGKQLRTNVRYNSFKAKDDLLNVRKQVVQVKESVSTLKSEARNNIPKIISELKESITKYKQEIEPQTEKLKQELESLQQSITEIENNLSEANNKKENK
ncbi:YtxH domain-containing protein [Ureibacillus sp. NPDC094379]